MWQSVSKISLFLLISLSCGVLGSHNLKRLERYNVNPDLITVSGFSSGGTFAQQMFVSHSSTFAGLAVFSHTFYRCGFGNGVLADYDAVCTRTPTPNFKKVEYNPNNAILDIHSYFHNGLIDNPYVHLKNKPLYVFTGTKNYLFTQDMSLRIVHVFKPFIRNKKSIKVRTAAANLTLPSQRKDLPGCDEPTNKIQVSNCGFSGALDAMYFLLGPKIIEKPGGHLKLQPLFQFDQTEFFVDGRHDLDTVGYLYIPKACHYHEAQCLLHLYFHGCSTGREFVGPHHIVNSGFLEVAETNGIIMIFPQAISSPENEIGCWDTFGVTGKLYATREGAQVAVVKNMLDRVVRQKYSSEAEDEGPPPPPPPMITSGSSISQILNRFSFPKMKCASLANCILWKQKY